MTLEVVPVTDEAGHASWYAAMVDAQLVDRPYGDWSTVEPSLLWLTRPPTEREPQAWSAVDDGRVVGAAMANWPLLDNAHLGDFSVGVLPSERRRGVGSALLDAVTDDARRRGRSTLASEVHRPYTGEASAGGRFLARHGYTVAMTEVHFTVSAPLADELLDSLAAEVADATAGYRMISWVGRCPDEWAEGVCVLESAFLTQAPIGDLDIEPETWTVQRLRDAEDRRKQSGRTTYSTAAVAPDGSLAGNTELSTSQQMVRGGAAQSGTLVLPEHRGHRLGLAMKVANQRAAQAHDPAERLLHTWNELDNTHMIGVNERLGYRPVEFADSWQLRLG